MTHRIAYMTGQYPRATDIFIQREVLELRRNGFHVQTLSIRRPKPSEQPPIDGRLDIDETFYVLESPWVVVLYAHLCHLFRRPLRYLSALKLAVSTRPPGLGGLAYQLYYFVEAGVVARHLHRSRLVHLHNHFADSSCSVAMIAAELGAFSYSFTLHGSAIFFAPEYWRLDEKLTRACFVACVSHFCRSQAMVFSSPEVWDRFHIVHCGVDPSHYKPRVQSAQAERLLFVGQLARVKGLIVLLRALAIVMQSNPGVHLTIVGDGLDRSRLEHEVTALGLQNHVRFVGYRTQDEVRQYLSESDVFAMSSFAEGVPVVLMEAMAAGVAVTAPQIAGIPELVDDGVSGFLTPPGDAETLADRLSTLLNDSELRQRFAEAGIQKVHEQFNLHHEASWLVCIMRQALAPNADTMTSAIGLRPQTPLLDHAGEMS